MPVMCTSPSQQAAKVTLSDAVPWDSIRGLKSAISNPNVSEQAKEKDRKKLRDLGEAVV